MRRWEDLLLSCTKACNHDIMRGDWGTGRGKNKKQKQEEEEEKKEKTERGEKDRKTQRRRERAKTVMREQHPRCTPMAFANPMAPEAAEARWAFRAPGVQVHSLFGFSLLWISFGVA